ncbi:sulfatase [Flexithrix dorotheae]|uniref:sulfatase n=1 Tax=Flexithrix dorotheae TaxID=70993 RepID=UPI00036413AC|nr:sulfatase [Flexithrix dorotheae]
MNYKNLIYIFLIVIAGCKKEDDSEKAITSTPKPNFIFILADDYGYHDLSVMGSQYYETPNIDRIANEGMIFTDGYAACQVCSPSRASIMLGTFPARHGITDWIGAKTGEAWRKAGRFNKLLPPEYVHKLPAEAITLPEAMREGGYKTFFAGKWHLGDSTSWPENHGFDINKGGWDAGSPNGGYFSPFTNPRLENRKDGENLSMRLASETVDFIKANHPKETGKPFFAYLSFYAVHGPIQTTQEKWAKYRQKAEELGIAEKGFEMGHFLPIRQVQDNPVYAGLVEAMDDAVGEVLKAVDELGLGENTVIVFTSDNGGVAAGDAFATSNLPLRAGKGYQFEGGIREPYFIKVPGVTKGGGKTSVPASGTDFYPTILELAGLDLKPDQHVDGKSLVPVLKGGTLPERPLIWHYPHYGNQGGEPSSIIREGDWKLIHYYEDGREELYNLKNDLEETTDLAGENAERASTMSKKLFAMLDEMGARYPTKDPEWTAELEQKHMERIVNELWPNLEKKRMEYLSPDFNPDNDWWGSQVTKD